MSATAAPPGALDLAAARAATLDERLAAAAAPPPPLPDDAPLPAAAASVVDARLRAWRETVASGDESAFAKRLRWDGLDAASARRVLAGDPAAPAVPAVPAAVAGRDPLELLRAAYGETPEDAAAAFARLAPGPDRALRPTEPLPFEELYLPLLSLARDRAEAAAGHAYALLEPDAHAALERALLRRLTRVGERALFAELVAHRSWAAQSAASLRAFGLPADDAARSSGDAYRDLVDGLRQGRIIALFADYAVAGRLLARVTELWVEAVAEFACRVAEDGPALAATFGGGAPLGTVARLQSDMGDPHEGGRAVIIAQFASGVRVVYKPRPLALEAFFAELVGWLGGRGGLPSLWTPALVARATHGWLEFVEHRPCAGEDAAARYFERCGVLIGLAYVLGGSDFHHENVIACGEHPVLIDMEGLLGHRFAPAAELPTQDMAAPVAKEWFARSVLSGRLLPWLRVANDGRAEDLGGLVAADERGVEAVVSCWADVNRGAMRLERRATTIRQRRTNLPRLADDTVVRADGHVDAIERGFRAAYRLLLAHRDEMLAPGGVLAQVKGCPVRFILRNTSLYAALLERCLHPKYLRDGAARGIQLDVLARPLLAVDARPAVWPAVAAERLALEQMDVPIFAARADSADLVLQTGEVVAGCFEASAFDEMAARLGGLDDADLELQTETIRTAFRAAAADGLRAPVVRVATARPELGPDAGVPDAGAPDAGAPDADALRARAVETAARLARAAAARARRSAAGDASWVGTSYLGGARRHTLGPMALGTLEGYGGVAIFLAAAGRAAGDPAHGALARAALVPLRSRLAELERAVRLRRFADVGGATGLGAAAYALLVTGRLLGDADVLEDARRVAALITPGAVEAHDPLGVVSGSAGAVLSLLALHDARADQGALDRAAALGAHLLARRTHDAAAAGAPSWWGTRAGRPEPGFAHGQSGIAYALLRLAGATGDRAFADAGREAVAAERELPGAAPDALEAQEPGAAWSHGATGVGLARLGASDEPELRADAERCVEIARRHLDDGPDTLCCGRAGRVELLLAAAERLGRPELRAAALRAVDRMLAGAAERGGFDSGWGDGALHLGLLQGASGAAYQALRATDPASSLPALLLWA